jgi:hypothetical protein
MRQHRIDHKDPPIADDMTSGREGFAIGTGTHDLLGTFVAVYEIPDSDRGETLLLRTDGFVLLLSCDPGYEGDTPTGRTPDKWQCCQYDATETAAGRAMQTLERGHWL